MLSGTAAWLLQRVRRNSSASGASAAGEANAEESPDSGHGLPSFVGEMWVPTLSSTLSFEPGKRKPFAVQESPAQVV